ncbi:MAG TPA: double-strand break repair protein AddB [Acetobacteraceae bacterium]|nr:double-strand break repair protein AddB [Acetobacteraceae bacterium]
MNLFNIAPGVPFLDALAAEWLRRAGPDPLAVARGLILLPTRRAARALAEAFLRATGGKPLMLPRITAFGALDEAPLTLSGALDLPPAVEPTLRLAGLSRLILAMGGTNGAPRTADRAWPLAAELAALMDEAERAEIDLAARLPDAADPAFAAHWTQTLQFLHIVTRAWPEWLTEQGLMNPTARLVALLDAQASAWTLTPPDEPILAAGTTGGIPAVARLLRVIAGMPHGSVVLPGLNTAMSEQAWAALDAAHPQFGLAQMLHRLSVTRGDVAAWPGSGDAPDPAIGDRAATLSHALLPADALEEWRQPGPAAVGGLSQLSAADQHEEAVAIAMVLRDALEAPSAVAALVTPDRDLASRVATQLLRFGVVADDSAGEPLVDCPPAVFLRLLARALAERLAPVALLGLLKHPLTAAGLAPAACRAAARALELACLRGPRPRPGIVGLRRALSHAPGQARFLERLERCLEPALRMDTAVEIAPADAIAALVEAAERLAATDELAGPSRLWAGEEGEALATRLAQVQAALPMLPDQRREVIPPLLDALLEGGVVRSRRALRGRGGTEHPRVFIWGLLEARLQSADVMVLGGLAEGVWPPTTDPGAWLSRPMRSAVGLPSPEEIVGQAAHDFVSSATAARQVVLSCPRRRDGAPVVPARWLTRLEALLAGQGRSLPTHPAVGWARALDQPGHGVRSVRPPQPRPPVVLRPRRLSVTEIETWLRDPYAIYARHVLRLNALRPVDETTDAADYGSLVHAGMHHFLEKCGADWPADAAEQLRRAMARALAEADLREALAAWWAPRLERIADWVATVEAERRALAPLAALATEARGSLDLQRPGGEFRLVGRADRIERRAGGGLAILDYKTGAPPTQKEVDAGLAPQLPLEAAMAAAGAFGETVSGTAEELTYWHLTGGFHAGELRTLYKGDAAAIAAGIEQARSSLVALIDAFDDPARAYLSQPQPGFAPRFSDYAQLARVAEWAAVGDEE